MNLYPIILGLVALGGVIISVWGWRVMQQAQQKKQWPTAQGTITESLPSSEDDAMLPHIIFEYRVADDTYSQAFKFPEDTNPLPEFAQAYVQKYPVAKQVTVYYNPSIPSEATLEPGTRGDWMILALGIMMMLAAIGALILA